MFHAAEFKLHPLFRFLPPFFKIVSRKTFPTLVAGISPNETGVQLVSVHGPIIYQTTQVSITAEPESQASKMYDGVMDKMNGVGHQIQPVNGEAKKLQSHRRSSSKWIPASAPIYERALDMTASPFRNRFLNSKGKDGIQ